MRKNRDTTASNRPAARRATQIAPGPEARVRDSYDEGLRIGDVWQEQARKLLGLDDDRAVCVGMAARIFYEIGTEFLPALRFDQPVKLGSHWEEEVGLEKLYSSGRHLPNKLRSLFGDAHGADLLDIIRDEALACDDPEAARRFVGCDSMAAIVPARPSAVTLLTVLSIPREWRDYLRDLTRGFAGLAEWVSKRPTTVERMCRLLVHGYLLASSLMECIVLFEYAAWRGSRIADRPSTRSIRKKPAEGRKEFRRKRSCV